jgi:hypothetical protein
MNDPQQQQTWEQSAAQLAREYPFPPTPDLTAAVRQRTAPATPPVPARHRAPSWAVATAIVLTVLALGVLAVPQTRAAVWSLVVRIGAIRIFVDEPAPATPVPLIASPISVTPAEPTPVPLALLAALPGEAVAIDSLSSFAAFPLQLPSGTLPWGPPDSAVVHPVGNTRMVTLVWNDSQQPGQPVLTLSQTDLPQLAFKMAGADQMTTVQLDGGEALWIEAPHTIQLPIDGGPDEVRIASNVLVWSDGVMTYRIEGAITQDEAIRLANSLVQGSTVP